MQSWLCMCCQINGYSIPSLNMTALQHLLFFYLFILIFLCEQLMIFSYVNIVLSFRNVDLYSTQMKAFSKHCIGDYFKWIWGISRKNSAYILKLKHTAHANVQYRLVFVCFSATRSLPCISFLCTALCK